MRLDARRPSNSPARQSGRNRLPGKRRRHDGPARLQPRPAVPRAIHPDVHARHAARSNAGVGGSRYRGLGSQAHSQGRAVRERRAECEAAAAALCVSSLRELSLRDLARAAALPQPLNRRARHVITENARVVQSVGALTADQPATMGALLRASHHSLSADFDASLPAIDRLVGLANDDPMVFRSPPHRRRLWRRGPSALPRRRGPVGLPPPCAPREGRQRDSPPRPVPRRALRDGSSNGARDHRMAARPVPVFRQRDCDPG